MSDKKEVAISVKNLHKTFKLPHEQHSGIKQLLVGVFNQKRKKGYELQHVLKGLDFDIEQGDFFGIVGRNGSGKSTLLKTLAGIYSPEKGAVRINGTLVPFIELGVGFNPELTGRENVFLNGALLGFSRDEMSAMYDDIIQFAELEKFMDQKLKNYSSGMQVRLAFSIAIRADADILLLDEVLAVGDEAFQRKCFDYFMELKRKKKTVILVTHDMGAVKKFCNKAMMIHKGEVIISGSPEDVANEYNLKNLTALTSTRKEEEEFKKNTAIKEFKVELIGSTRLNQDDKVEIKYTVTSKKDIKARVVMDLGNIDEGYYVYCMDTPERVFVANKPVSFTMTFDVSMLNNMNIVVHSSVRNSKEDMIAIANDKNSPTFIMRRTDYKDDGPQAGVIYKDSENARITY